jgi:hypothetical protein
MNTKRKIGIILILVGIGLPFILYFIQEPAPFAQLGSSFIDGEIVLDRGRSVSYREQLEELDKKAEEESKKFYTGEEWVAQDKGLGKMEKLHEERMRKEHEQNAKERERKIKESRGENEDGTMRDLSSLDQLINPYVGPDGPYSRVGRVAVPYKYTIIVGILLSLTGIGLIAFSFFPNKKA